jgi:sulfite exporter TauE/SafE
MEASAALTPAAAFAIGLATSLHCSAMCGPLACAFRVKPLEYHASRFVSYTTAGAVCGAAGAGIVELFQGETSRFVPWVLAAVLVMLAFGLERRLPQPRLLAVLLLRIRLNRSLGWLTPLLPCGPLWLMLAAAAVTGSWWSGAIHMAAFVAGTIPLFYLVQSQATRLQGRFSAQIVRWSQQSLALLSAGLLVWRASLPLHACCH